ncbi:MAG: tyrosine-type recombinase/integrase [Caulobacter sp.]|nr:tyrosine-type recombinase/integrase [Caulobacter sp.]
MPADPALRAPGRELTDGLAERARAYARSAWAEATLRAYAADWRMWTGWCRRHGLDPSIPDPRTVGLFLADSAGRCGAATLARRLSGLAWTFRGLGTPLDRTDPHVREVLAGIRRRHSRPPRRKTALSAAEVVAMTETLGHGLRGLRDRAILLLGFAGALRRSEIVGLDAGRGGDGRGWIERTEEGLLLHVAGKTGWREVAVGPGSSGRTCPVAALTRWLELGRIADGPLFRRVSADGRRVLPERLSDRHVARLVRAAALAVGVTGDIGGHSLRAGMATSAAVEERHVQAHLGHASAEMTRRYQRDRDRFRVNLTRAAGL